MSKSYSVKEIIAYRKYVMYKYAGKRIRSWFWLKVRNYYSRKEMSGK